MYIEFNDLKKSKYTINDYEFVEFPNIVRIYFIDNVIFQMMMVLKYIPMKKLVYMIFRNIFIFMIQPIII